MICKQSGIRATLRGSKLLQISVKEKKLCHFYELQAEESDEMPVSHHILLVDGSGSMHTEIPELKTRVKQTLDVLKRRGNSYVSIIIYSGHEESYRIVNAVRCDTISYKMARVYETVEKELYTRSITVMSEPLEKAIEIVKELGDVCDQHHIALMTDGCLVPSRWHVEKEEEKCLKVATYCSQVGIYFNAIGFGKYYDRQFLTKMVEQAQMGQFHHIDAIKDYCKTMASLIEKVGSQRLIDIPINHNNFFVCNTAMWHDQPVSLKSIPGSGTSLIVTFEEGIVETGEVSEEMVADFLYSLATYHVMYEDLESAEIVVAKTRDLEAYMVVKNCYSFIEKGKAIKVLTELSKNKGKRYKKGKVPIKVPPLEEEPLCLLEVLQEILEDKEAKLLWNYQYPYKRIGIKQTDTDWDYHFIRSTMGYGEVVSLSIGAEKLNIGIKVKLEGMVEEAETGISVGAFIYRDYNLVVNGNINTTQLWCELSRELKSKLRKQKLIKSTTKLGNRSICTLDLTKLKATNKRMQKSLSQQQLASYLYDLEVLGCRQWAIKKNIEKLKKEKEDFERVDDIRKRFKIDGKGMYKSAGVIKNEILPYEVYPAEVLIWKVEKFPKKKTQEEMLSYYQEMDYKTLKHALYEVQKEKRIKQDKINLVRLACGLTGQSVFLWEKQIEKDKLQTDKVLGMNVVVGEKVQIATKVIDHINVREDRYTVLTRCN